MSLLLRQVVLRGDLAVRMNKNLTTREQQILECASKGLSHKQMVTELDIAMQTIKNHITIILLKLDANNMPHAVAIGLRQGIIK